MNEDLVPMTLDQLIAALESIRAEHGGSIPVLLADYEPVVSASVDYREAILEEGDKATHVSVVISDRLEGFDPSA